MTDWLSDPESRAWTRRVLDELVPKIEGSALTVSLVPRGATDVKFAVELGLSIMLDKPIVLVVAPGTPVPEHLMRVADELVELDVGSPSPDASERLRQAVNRVIGEPEAT